MFTSCTARYCSRLAACHAVAPAKAGAKRYGDFPRADCVAYKATATVKLQRSIAKGLISC